MKTNKNPSDHINLEKEEELSEGERYPQAPDGGYGWIIVLSSFMIHFIADGVTYTFGIFYVELVKYFNAGKGLTAWVPSIMTGMTYGIGPIASGLTNKYGCRAITITGAIFAAAGMLFGALAPNVAVLFFTVGICAGAGFGLIYLPAIVSVTCYFDKRRAFATGIAVCGSGIGSAAFAPFTEWLIGIYGWQGAMLIISGILLNCCVFGALFRPLDIKFQRNPTSRSSSEVVVVKKIQKFASLEISEQLMKKQPKNFCYAVESDDNENYQSDVNPNLLKSKSISPSRHSISGYHPNGIQSKNSDGLQSQQNQEKGPNQRLLDCACQNSGKNSVITRDEESSNLANKRKHSCSSSSGILYRKDIFYSASLASASLTNLHSHPPNSLAASCSVSSTYVNDVSANERTSETSNVRGFLEDSLLSCGECGKWWVSNCCGKEVRDTLSEMMDFRLLRNKIFLLFSISNLLTSLGYYVPHIYIKDRVAGLNIATDHEANNLLAIIGISSTFGRLVFGFISDLKSINRLLLFNCCLTSCGLSILLSSLFKSYTFMALYCAFFGITCGAYVSLTSVILVDLLGLEKLTNAFGLVLLFQGLGCLIGPPVVGWLFDLTKSYDPGFIWAGSMITIGGSMLFVVPHFKKRSEQKPKTPTVVINTNETINLS